VSKLMRCPSTKSGSCWPRPTHSRKVPSFATGCAPFPTETPKMESQNSPENQPSPLPRNQLAWASSPPSATCLSYVFKFCDVSPAVLRYRTPYIYAISPPSSFLRLAFVILLILCELACYLLQMSSSSSYRCSSRLILRGPTPLLFLSRPFILCGRAPRPTCSWVC